MLDEIGFQTPTDIQAQAIPPLLQNDIDLIGLAQTGTGKTAAFGLPIIDKVEPGTGHIEAVILAPTRELVQQIALELQAFSKYKSYLHLTTVYGGSSISQQIKEIKKDKPSILVATPGRLIDLINRKVVKLSDLRFMILDEADEMLNMGFQEDVDEILSHAPKGINTWLFSATMPSGVQKIVKSYMQDPVKISIDAQHRTNVNLSHKYILVEKKNKSEALKRLIDITPEVYGIIFCRTKRETQSLADELTRDGYRSDALHGDLSQNQRDRVLNKFRNGNINLLVATDVAARGIDVDNLTHVFHFTLPDTAEYYTHRSGRTARAGKEGTSLVVLIPQDKRKMNGIAQSLKIEFEQVMIPQYVDLLNSRLQSWTEKIIDTDTTDVTAGMVNRVVGQLDDLDRDTLVAKLIARQLKLLKRKAATEDLNATDRKRSKQNKPRRGERRSSRREDRRKPRGGGNHTMFINIGRMDKVKPQDLVRFISETSGVSKKDIGDIHMNKMNSTFELNHKNPDKISRRFEDVQLYGRDIRCNRK